MSTKRQPSKQRRQTQNQKQRAALEARRAAAAAGKAPAGKVGGSTSSEPRGSVLSRLRGGGAASSPSSATSGGGSALSRLRGASTTGRAVRTSRSGGELPVGHRAAMSALFAAIAAAVVGSFIFPVTVDRGGEPITTRGALVAEWAHTAADAVVDDPEATPAEIASSIDDWMPAGTENYLQAYWPLSAAVLLPVIGTGLGFRTVSKRSPAKLVNRTMYVTLFGTLIISPLLLLFLPAVISLAVAAFQVRKAEVTATRAAMADDDEVEADDDDVIEVDEVDEVDELDEDDVVDVEAAADVGDAVEVDEREPT